MEDGIFFALAYAVEKGDTDGLHYLLNRGADPNLWPKSFKGPSLIELAAKSPNSLEIMKLLVFYGLITSDELSKIFELFDVGHVFELVSYIVEHNNREPNLLQMVFRRLSRSDIEGPDVQDMLKYLLDCGMPADCILKNTSTTPLYISIRDNRPDFVSLLLEYDINIHRRTKKGETSLILAVKEAEKTIVESLLKKKARVNDTENNGATALHSACELDVEIETVQLLLKYGSDINIKDREGLTPLQLVEDNSVQEVLIERIAILKIENQFICNENLEYIEADENLTEFLDNCLYEFDRMKSCVIFKAITLFEIFKMRKNMKRLVTLTKNFEFRDKFRTGWDRESFRHYARELDDVFTDAENRRIKFEAEEKKLYSVFKNCLPRLAIEKIAYFANEDLFSNFI